MSSFYKSLVIILFLCAIGWGYVNYRTNTYVTAEFSNLRPFHSFAPIYYNGFKIGRVVKVRPNKTYTSTIVTMEFHPYDLKLPVNISASLKKEKNRWGRKFDYIDIMYPKDPSIYYLKDGDRISGKTTVDVESFFANQDPETLEQIKVLEEFDSSKIYSWWEMLNRDFKHLNENYQDYISKFYSPKTEELLKTNEFLIFKESFIKYLREFIKGLQINVPNIKYLLNHINDEEAKIRWIVQNIIKYEKENIALETDYNEKESYELHYGRYLSMREWFIGASGNISIADNLLESTSEIIRKITRYALQIVEMQTSGGSRKGEYKALIEMFNKCIDINEAHKLSSVVFGVMSSKHIGCDIERETENINSGIYEEKATTVIVQPSNRYRAKTANRNSVKEKMEAKKLMAKQILEKRQREKEIIESKIINNRLSFKELDNITAEERRIFLTWLSYSLNKKGQEWIRNEYGRYYKIANKNETEKITLKCEDGDFIMPAYEIIFKEEV